MGYNVQYIYKDIDNSLSRIVDEYNFKDEFYIEKKIGGIEIILEKNGSIIQIFTLFRFSNDKNNDLLDFEKYLMKRTNSKVYKLNGKLLDEWNSIMEEEYWEKDNNLVNSFFNWIEEQDASLWCII